MHGGQAVEHHHHHAGDDGDQQGDVEESPFARVGLEDDGVPALAPAGLGLAQALADHRLLVLASALVGHGAGFRSAAGPDAAAVPS
ncbi:hypothetical protein D3C86_1987580 [compost metagenome]